MPGGIPVGTLAIGKAGAINAALLATAILGAKNPEFREALRSYRVAQTERVLANPNPAAAASRVQPGTSGNAKRKKRA
jgi:5-(carboxyamino)imidazole ribonucleotide mutase